MLIFSTDKKRLLEHFLKDPVLFAYHIGDLDDFLFDKCQWAVDYEERAHIHEVILLYSGGTIPTVVALGLSGRFAPLLDSMLDLLPPKFICHFQKESRPQLTRLYDETDASPLYRMKLGAFKPREDNPHIHRLGPSDEKRLVDFYPRAYPNGYFIPYMLQTGKYFGYEEDGKLLSVAGVHVHSEEHKVAVLGSIATLPEARGRGLATSVTSKLISDIDPDGRLVCLNVEKNNTSAIRCYENLGFEPVYELEGSIFELKK